MPEAARILRPGGRLAFLSTRVQPATACCEANARRTGIAWSGGGVERHPSHGDWSDYYDIATAEWASRWPAEELWVARLAT